ncbi:MAG: hypothetical protein ACOCXP_02195 [Candidatus Dojkabacteria bacterium]
MSEIEDTKKRYGINYVGNLLDLPNPQSRLKELRARRSFLCDRLNEISPPISFITTGSVEYGVNGRDFGNVDDIDSLLVVPEGLLYNELISIFYEPSLKLSLTDIPDSNHYSSIHADTPDTPSIVRISAKSFGVPVNMHVISQPVMARAIVNPGSSVNTLLPNNGKYYKPQLEADIGFGRAASFQYEITPYDSNQRILLKEYIFRHSKDSARYTLGVVGCKLIVGNPIYESNGMQVSRNLEILRRQFMEFASRQSPSATDEDIISSVVRSKRFSDKFKEEFRVNVLDRYRD